MVDLIETAEYLAEDSAEVADRFFDALESTLEDIKRTPKIGVIKRYRDSKDVRIWFIKGFERSLIFYTETPDEIVILRVIHVSRDYTRFFDE